MRKMIGGLIGVVWGGALIAHWATSRDSQDYTGVAIGAVILVIGIYYLNQWNKER